MLIPRLLTALVLIPLVVLCLFFLPLQYFVMVILVVLALSAWEWAQFLAISKLINKCLFTLSFTALSALIYYFSVNTDMEIMIFESILILSVVWWLVALLLVARYPKSAQYWQGSLPIKLSFSFFTLVPFFIGMIQLRQIGYGENTYMGAFWLLYVLVLVWATDSGAYFAGRLWGRRKLAPSVSPGKTIEGLIGGLVVSIVICIIVYISHFFEVTFYNLIVSSILAILASVLGDLTESMFKRQANIKDSGHLIPGHGGVLDRIDSLTSAIPVFAALTLYLL